MGLDMYLYIAKSKYNSTFRDEEMKYPDDLAAVQSFITDLNGYSSCIKQELYLAGYWRKVNQVHSWIVNNCADGIDECQRIYIPVKKLEELRNNCIAILADHTKAAKLLPTSEGFFFGSTEYDEYYYSDLERTVKILDTVLTYMGTPAAEESEAEVMYQASW